MSAEHRGDESDQLPVPAEPERPPAEPEPVAPEPIAEEPTPLPPRVDLFTHSATGVVMRLLESLIDSNITADGLEHIDDRPTLYVVNHFTRYETFIVPYVLYKYTAQRVHTITFPSFFHGAFGAYLSAVGAVSLKDPTYKRRLVGDLISGRANWVIYPEGAMIKSKKTFDTGRYIVSYPGRTGPPHTGSAVLALQAELAKRRYLAAADDADARRAMEREYFFAGEAEICRSDIVVMPVTITYYPIRPGTNIATKLARLLFKQLPPGLEEELLVEGRLLLADTEMNIHFGEGIPIPDFLSTALTVTAPLKALIGAERRDNLLIRGLKHRLTRRFMGAIYRKVRVNPDHLVCAAIRHHPGDRLGKAELARVVFCLADSLSRRDDVRLHSRLRDDTYQFLLKRDAHPLDDILSLAIGGEVLSPDGPEHYLIDHRVMEHEHEHDRVRVENPMAVIANELEPLQPAIKALRRLLKAPTQHLDDQIGKALHEDDLARHETDHQRWRDDADAKPNWLGRPFLLKQRGARVGIVLSHGYLSGPMEVRDLGEHCAQLGCTVYGPRLAGHGTAPGDLADTDWEAWLESYLRGLALVGNSCDMVIAAGFSVGGLLALRACAECPSMIAGVITINTPLALRDPRMRYVPAVSWWNQVAKSIGFHRGAWDYVDNPSEAPEVNYLKNPVHGVHQIQQLVDDLVPRLGAIRQPALICQSDQDPVVDPGSADRLREALGSEQRDLVGFSDQKHIIMNGPCRNELYYRIGDWLREHAGL